MMRIETAIVTENGNVFKKGEIVKIELKPDKIHVSRSNLVEGMIIRIESDGVELDCSDRYESKHAQIPYSNIINIYTMIERDDFLRI